MTQPIPQSSIFIESFITNQTITHMKTKHTYIFLVIASISLLLIPSKGSNFREQYTPILMTRENLEQAIKLTDPQELERAHQLHVKGDYIYIVKQYEGVHIIDNTNPKQPVNKAFLFIPGCTNIASKGNYLYADSGVDLVTIELNGTQTTEVNRVKNILAEIANPFGYIPYDFTANNRPANTIIIGWELTN